MCAYLFPTPVTGMKWVRREMTVVSVPRNVLMVAAEIRVKQFCPQWYETKPLV